MTLEWKETYSTGSQTIDAQHRSLFRYTDQLGQYIADGVSSGRDVDNLMGTLTGYAAAHFLYEEGCMRQRQCRLHEKNIQEHDGFRQQVAVFSQRLEDERPRLQVLRELHEMLEGWLVMHIVEVDSTLREKALKPCGVGHEALPQT